MLVIRVHVKRLQQCVGKSLFTIYFITITVYSIQQQKCDYWKVQYDSLFMEFLSIVKQIFLLLCDVKPKKTADIFRTPPMVSPRHEVSGTSAEISQSKRNICLTMDKNSIKRLSYYTFQQSHFCCQMLYTVMVIK